MIMSSQVMANLHYTLNFEPGKTDQIFYLNYKEHVEISTITTFSILLIFKILFLAVVKDFVHLAWIKIQFIAQVARNGDRFYIVVYSASCSIHKIHLPFDVGIGRVINYIVYQEKLSSFKIIDLTSSGFNLFHFIQVAVMVHTVLV